VVNIEGRYSGVARAERTPRVSGVLWRVTRAGMLGLFVGVSVAWADQTPDRLTLDQSVAEALQNNPEIRSLTADVAAARGEVTTAKTWANPELSIAPGARHTSGVGTEFHGEATLTQTFEFPGNRALRRALAEKDVDLRQLALDGFRQQLTIEVRRAFNQVLASHQVVELKEQRLKLATGFAEAAKRKVEGGFGPEFELTKAQAEGVAAQIALRDAHARHDVAHVTLGALLGRDSSAPFEILGELNAEVPPLNEGFLRQEVALRNPALKIQTAAVERADLNLKAVLRSRLPEVTIGPSLEYLDDEQTAGLEVSLPLPLWDRKQGAVATASAERLRARAERDQLRQELERDVIGATRSLSAAKESLAYYTPQFRRSLKATLDAAAESYAQGRTTLLIFLEMQRTYFDVQGEYFEILERLLDAQAQLEAALGVPLVDLQATVHAGEQK